MQDPVPTSFIPQLPKVQKSLTSRKHQLAQALTAISSGVQKMMSELAT